ncbi:MAG TPA: HEAT repeat domain-containing protein, partial [Clostridia bacterium]|nr:HEAT repeat domain-containing protein [Clostridia bacterium]
LVLTAAVWILFHQQLSHYIGVNLVLRTPSPREEAFEELAVQMADPCKFLERCWLTGKVPHRQLVMAYLSKKAAETPPWFANARRLVLAGTTDPDMSVRELALATLQLCADPQLSECAANQLADVDPMIRQLGLNYLRKIETPTAMSRVIELLDDPDIRVVTSAEATLMRWTAEDFGVRSWNQLPRPARPRGLGGEAVSRRRVANHSRA